MVLLPIYVSQSSPLLNEADQYNLPINIISLYREITIHYLMNTSMLLEFHDLHKPSRMFPLPMHGCVNDIIFFRLLFCNCLKLQLTYENHSLSSDTLPYDVTNFTT